MGKNSSTTPPTAESKKSKKKTSSGSSKKVSNAAPISATQPSTTSATSVAKNQPVASSNTIPVGSPVASVSKPKKSTTTKKSSKGSTPSTNGPTLTSSMIQGTPGPTYPMISSSLGFPMSQFSSKNSIPQQNFEIAYMEEISNMITCFCFSNRADPSTIRIIEQYTKNHIMDIICQLYKFANSKSVKTVDQVESVDVNITVEEVLFFIKKDALKFARFENMIRVRELRKKESEPEEEIEGKKRKNAFSHIKDKRLKLDPILDIGQFSDDESETPTSNESDLLETNSDSVINNYMQEKRRAADFLSKNLSLNDYLDYTKCRESNFVSKGIKKFRQWLEIPPDLKINDNALELLALEAYETVGKLCQIALICLIDRENRIVTPFEDSLFTAAGLLTPRERRMYSQFPQLQEVSSSSSTGTEHIHRPTITASHLLDAITLIHPPSVSSPRFCLRL
ncbi:hypothetical protein C9374_009910 [Naegleria lovaniensis]|uniref:Uncharacterized protein n=1 Tax=Naegleria lovaniensis TaxID=51637 RepID=A0AA88GD07_NAELO|nr:uncharacterized protein C9374_009910 [Naegleria lovaniensis]KAG2375287.1 hypothetical protein C9374_009910 [Naegleria lovaniensis]